MLGAAETVLGNVADLPSRSVAEFENAREAYFSELDRHADPNFDGLIVDKLPLNMLGLPVIHSLFPDARVIFAQRHPCDAVLSGFMQSFTLNDAMACFLTIEDAADLYDVSMGLFSRARDLLPIATHTLIYENLVSEPEAALRPLLEFLGLEWCPELLDHRSTAKSRGAIITPSYDQVTQPLSRTRWRGRRPHVRGMAMNPIDHPMGGGQGKSKGGGGRHHPVSPWGQLAKGFKTRAKHKPSDRFILERRRGKKRSA